MSARTVCLGLLLIGWLGIVRAGGAEEKKPTPPAMQAAFNRLKGLAGDWAMTGNDGQPGKQVTNRFRVTAAGSAVVETLFPGTDHEMVTVYHLDGDDLVLTHYCAAQNQPHMRAERTTDPKTLAFKFVRATNLKSDKDQHMHEVTIHFVDADHVKMEAVGYQDGKPAGTMEFNLARVKKGDRP